MLRAGKEGVPIVQNSIEGRLRDMTSALEKSFDVTLEVLVNAMILKNPETGAHLKRVAAFAILIARTMGLSSDTVVLTGRGALLHDIGKLAVPDSILSKVGPLDSEEIEIMRAHCAKGHELVKKVPFLKDTADVIYSHHENYDGTGYPRGLRGDGIPLGARIVSLGNTLEAITSNQPYRAARPMSAAMEEIERCAGTQFDPEIANVVLKMPEKTWTALGQGIGLRSA